MREAAFIYFDDD